MSIEIKKPHIDECFENRRRSHEDECCVCRTVKFIDMLQRKFALDGCCISCTAPRLGENVPGVNTFNTRPFILYTEDGSIFEIAPDPITAPTTLTSIFRVEYVKDCCAVLRALVVENGALTGTNACVTVDLCEFIGIQCLADVFIGCLPVVVNGNGNGNGG